MSRENLFSDQPIADYTNKKMKGIFDHIERIEERELLNTDEKKLCQDFLKVYSITPIRINIENTSQEQKPVEIDCRNNPIYHFRNGQRPFIKGLKTKLFIPFTGDRNLFFCTPSSFTPHRPVAEVLKSEIVFHYDQKEFDETLVQRDHQNNLNHLNQYLKFINNDIDSFNELIEKNLIQQILTRKNILIQRSEKLSKLGFQERNPKNKTYTVNLRAKVNEDSITFAPQYTTTVAATPKLAEDDYEDILKIMINMATVMENAPKPFISLGEENLRTHFLVQLNGKYTGQATGETFNKNGKTDIIIKKDSKNIFIAECKFWHGEKVFLETIDQLMNYTSWPDTKTAIIIFNKNKSLTNVLKTIKDGISKHKQFIRNQYYDYEKGFRAIYHHNDDHEREITITFLVFEIPNE